MPSPGDTWYVHTKHIVVPQCGFQGLQVVVHTFIRGIIHHLIFPGCLMRLHTRISLHWRLVEWMSCCTSEAASCTAVLHQLAYGVQDPCLLLLLSDQEYTRSRMRSGVPPNFIFHGGMHMYCTIRQQTAQNAAENPGREPAA